MRIFIGTEEIASLIADLASGFRELGHTVTTYVGAKNKFYTSHNYNIVRGTFLNDAFHYQDWQFLSGRLKDYINRVDIKITKPWLKWKNKKIIDDHDVFIFIWKSWLPESYLFPLLKKKGKKIVCMHVGSDVRHISAFEQQYNIDTSTWERYFHTDALEPKIKRIRYHELYADVIYSVPDQAGLYLRNYNHLQLSLSKDRNIKFNIPGRNIPLIVHAPSRSGIKGTDIVNKTVAQLKEDGYDLEYKLIVGLPNEKLLELLTDADILCDELFLHGPGMLSAEAMAAGCAVATRCLGVHPFQPPVCSVTPENLYEKLKLLITDIDYRTGLAKTGKKFVEDFNSPIKIAEKIMDDINKNNKSDYNSNFFIEKFQLPKNISLSDDTKMLTQIVIEKYDMQKEALKNDLKKRGLI
ncbi:MAG: hypothetical protein IPP81_01945 [Chitinophagaceae bacterium]|nr:hypothetical protein [Chitinophagaceae bacterium]